MEQSHSVLLKRSPKFDPVVGNAMAEIERSGFLKKSLSDGLLDCLRSGLAPTKEWAMAINRSDRRVQLWKRGEEPMPPELYDKILFASKAFFLRLEPLRVWIDQALMKKYSLFFQEFEM